MYSENLEELISLVLSDGNLTDEKRDIIKRRAEKEGEDVEEVMMVINSRLKKVCSHPEQKSDDEGNTQEKTKKGTETQEHLLVPENVVPKVLKIINVYNKKASKWGYDLLAYNANSHTISGKFTPITNAQDGKTGFWNEVKEIYKNGELEYEWEKILKLCGMK